MPVELYMLDKLKARIQLAREIDSVQHKAKKEKHERNWLKETAEAMEIELDSDLARYLPFLSHSIGMRADRSRRGDRSDGDDAEQGGGNGERGSIVEHP